MCVSTHFCSHTRAAAGGSSQQDLGWSQKVLLLLLPHMEGAPVEGGRGWRLLPGCWRRPVFVLSYTLNKLCIYFVIRLRLLTSWFALQGIWSNCQFFLHLLTFHLDLQNTKNKFFYFLREFYRKAQKVLNSNKTSTLNHFPWLKYYHPINKNKLIICFFNSRCIGILLAQSCLRSKEQKQQTKELAEIYKEWILKNYIKSF